jgi:hypothetical protein
MGVPAFIVRLMHRPALSPYAKLGPEDRISIEFANQLRAWTLEGRLKAVFFHAANEVGGGTKNAAIRYAVAKALGLITGTYDFTFLSDRGAWVIEMKAGKNRPTDGQKDFAAWCDMHGVKNAVCYSAGEAEIKLKEWGVLV